MIASPLDLDSRALQAPHAERWDVIVVGARCGGAATALCLAQRGLRVLVLDRGRYGADTLSTHALMRPAVHQLHRWGVLERLWRSAPAVTATTFYYAGTATRVPIRPRPGVPALLAPRRTVLDRELVDAARRAGARVEHGVCVNALLRGASGRICGVVARARGAAPRELRAALVIGADGRDSSMARWLGAHPYRLGRHRALTLYGYFRGLRDPDPGQPGYHWYFAPGVGSSLIPTGDGLWCVGATVPADSADARASRDPATLLARWIAKTSPDLVERLAPAERMGNVRVFAGLQGHLRPCQGPGWALVGDAGLFRDPGTAHGISDAFRDAELLADAAATGSEAALSRYQQARDELCQGVFDVTDQIAAFDWDMAQLAELHQRLSAEMKRELSHLPPADQGLR